MDAKTRAIFREIMREIGRKGDKRRLETMTPEERSAHVMKAAMGAAKKRMGERLAKRAATWPRRAKRPRPSK